MEEHSMSWESQLISKCEGIVHITYFNHAHKTNTPQGFFTRTQVQDSSTKANICRTNNQTKLKHQTMGFMNETIIDSILKCCSWQGLLTVVISKGPTLHNTWSMVFNHYHERVITKRGITCACKMRGLYSTKCTKRRNIQNASNWLNIGPWKCPFLREWAPILCTKSWKWSWVWTIQFFFLCSTFHRWLKLISNENPSRRKVVMIVVEGTMQM